MSGGARSVTGVRRGIPIAALPLLGAFLILVAGAVVAVERGREQVVAVAADLAAYHRIEQGDLETVEVRRPAPDDMATDAEELVGTITRKELPTGTKVRADDVTSAVDAQSFAGVRLRLRPARSTIVGATPGDPVSLRLAPSADSAAIGPASIPALLVDVVEEEGAETEYVVIVAEGDVRSLLRLAGRSDLLITPAAATRPPPS